jgi:hypothetical protein
MAISFGNTTNGDPKSNSSSHLILCRRQTSRLRLQNCKHSILKEMLLSSKDCLLIDYNSRTKEVRAQATSFGTTASAAPAIGN